MDLEITNLHFKDHIALGILKKSLSRMLFLLKRSNKELTNSLVPEDTLLNLPKTYFPDIVLIVESDLDLKNWSDAYCQRKSPRRSTWTSTSRMEEDNSGEKSWAPDFITLKSLNLKVISLPRLKYFQFQQHRDRHW